MEFETCSGGDSRVDMGILRYADQCWSSDNTDDSTGDSRNIYEFDA